jgi:hypothetical protein
VRPIRARNSLSQWGHGMVGWSPRDWTLTFIFRLALLFTALVLRPVSKALVPVVTQPRQVGRSGPVASQVSGLMPNDFSDGNTLVLIAHISDKIKF